MNHLVFSLLIILVSFSGFFIAAMISQKLRSGGTLVCPLGADCDAVIGSRYARFLGVPLTTWGLLYYAVIGLGTAAALIMPQWYTPGMAFLLITLSMAACVFSLYLTALQAFVLRQWCSWCLGSMMATLLIFLFSVISMEGAFPWLLLQFRPVIFFAYLFGLVIGVGGAVIYAVLFFKFLRDYKLSSTEKETLASVANVVVVGLGLVLVSGLGLFVPLPAWYMTNAEFALAGIIVSLLVVQAVLVKADIVPRLADMYDADAIPADYAHAYTRKLAYAFGSVGLISWIALLLVSIIDFRMSFVALLMLFALAIILGVLISQRSEYAVYRRSRNAHNGE